MVAALTLRHPMQTISRMAERVIPRARIESNNKPLVELTVSDSVRRHLKPLHAVQQPPLVGRVVASYCDQRDKILNSAVKKDYRFLPERMRFPATRAYVIPGFLGFRPPRAYLDEIASAFEHGVAFVSVSDEATLWQDGRHLILGGPKPAVQPDWPLEVATVLSRILADQILQKLLAARDGREPPSRIALIGHSKGGLIVHGIAAAARLAKTGRWETLFKVFPNLQAIDHKDLENLLHKLEEANKFAIATPFDGIGKKALLAARASGFTWLFAGAEDRFSPDYLEKYYDTLNFDPTEGLDAVVFASLSNSDLPNRAGFANPFVAIADYAFHLGGATLASGESDGLVDGQSRVFASRIMIPNQTHLTVFEDPESARQTREGFAAAIKKGDPKVDRLLN